MIICPNCSNENQAGSILCQNCGTDLTGENVLRTHVIKKTEGSSDSPGSDRRIVSLPKNSDLNLEIDGKLVSMRIGQNITLGRQAGGPDDSKTFDLEPYGAYAKGVSRRHCEIRRNSDDILVLVDVGSSNGTYLNGYLLDPLTRHYITHRDEIRLGEMRITVYYQ